MRRSKGTTVRTKTTLKCAAAIVAAVSLFVAITAVTFPRQRLLLSRARRIAPASFLWAGKFSVSYPCYWISDQQALTLWRPSIRNIALPNGLQTNASCLNTITGMYQPMPAFTQAVSTQLPDRQADVNLREEKTFFINTPCSVSPNGTWAVFTETTGNQCFYSPPIKSRNTLVNINDSHLLHGAWTSGESSILWGADSGSWVEWDGVDKNGANITSHTLTGTSGRQTISLPADLSNCSFHPCAITPANVILAEVEPPDTGSNPEKPPAPDCNCELVNLPIGSATPASRFTLVLPKVKNVLNRSITFSPRCDRVAWLVTYRYDVTGFPLLKQLRARLGDKPHQETAVWVSRLDGSDAHEIGHLAHKPDESRPQQLAWLPGGKQLSFNYKGDLYTVSAD